MKTPLPSGTGIPVKTVALSLPAGLGRYVSKPFHWLHRWPALSISLYYAFLATLWIVLSDALLSNLVTNPARISEIQTYKGLIFIIVTTLLLFFLLRVWSPDKSAAEQEGVATSHRSGLLIPVAVFLALSLAIGAAGYFAYHFQQEKVKHDKHEELAAIASLKVNQISAWLEERKGDASFLGSNSLLADKFEHWASQNPQDTALRKVITERLQSARKSFDYRNILLLDTHANVRLAARDEHATIDEPIRRLALEVMQTGKLLFSDLYRCRSEPGQPICLDLVAPLSVSSEQGERMVGAIMLRIAPERLLYPLIQTWPTPSPTAETLLVHREGDAVVFLNELRHRPGSAMNLRLPLNGKMYPAVYAIQGHSGMIEGTDYRGKAVLASLHAIHGTPWRMVSKIDEDEILAPTRTAAAFSAALSLLFIATAGIVVTFWWQRQLARQTLREANQERERLALAQHFDYLARYANDIILLMDGHGNIIEANERAQETYGYTREELLALNIRALHAPEAQAGLEDLMRQLERDGQALLETTHCSKDGSQFLVEDSTRLLQIDGQIFRQSIIRDVTERKAAQQKIERQLDELRRFQKVTVGRELRMKELAEENERLKAQNARPAPDLPKK